MNFLQIQYRIMVNFMVATKKIRHVFKGSTTVMTVKLLN